MNVHKFPRPPALELCKRRVRVIFDNVLLADSNDAYWVLETHHPPTYYIPRKDIHVELKPTSKSTYCEWKGAASYFEVNVNGKSVQNRCWSYSKPTPGFAKVKDYVSFYAGPWDCFVNDELVVPQPGDFYGGYMTSDIDGGSQGVKGGPGTWGW